jgi:N-glycosylase/DNA lyase
MEKLILEYGKKKNKIRKRLKEFRRVYSSKDRAIFEELCFCLFTPQANALSCDKAVKELKRSGILFRGREEEIRKMLKGKVRFQNNKAGYCVEARSLFSEGKILRVKKRIDPEDAFKTREWLVKNVKGLGYKEASHFLRNIGLGRDLAILDVHILRNLKRYGVIKEVPKSINRKIYLQIEEKMKEFSKALEIPLEELDLLFWSCETGFIFK